jgi:transposase-like protein
MARAYSDDLREKVLSAYASGKGTLRELAERFDVSYGWVAKIHAMELASGSRQRVPQRRRPSAVDRARSTPSRCGVWYVRSRTSFCASCSRRCFRPASASRLRSCGGR